MMVYYRKRKGFTMKRPILRYFTLLFSSLALILTSCDPDEFFNQPYSNSDPSKTIPRSAYYYPEKNVLQADSIYKMSGQQQTADFSVALSKRDISSGNEPTLFSSDGTEICKLLDNGQAPDRQAGDGIYSCRCDVTSADGQQKRYYVQTGDKKTDEICFTYFDELTEEDFDRFNEISDMFEEAVSEYTTDDGYTEDPDKALKAADKVAKALYESGEAVDYSYQPDNGIIRLKLNSGLTYIYAVKEEGTSAGVITQAPEISITTCQPSDHLFSERLKKKLKKPENAAKVLDLEFNNAIYSGNYLNSAVTRILLWTFSPNQVILWEGHGNYDKDLGPCVWLGECFSTSETKFSYDYISDRVVCSKDGYLGITSKFIDEYCGNLSNSLIYMGCCSSGEDSRLAESFISKGAALFVGSSKKIEAKYSYKMADSFMSALTMKEDDVYLNAHQALRYAKKENGKYDTRKNKAALLLFGDTSYSMDPGYIESHPVRQTTDTHPDGSEYLELDKSYISMKVGEQETLTITHAPSGYNLEDPSSDEHQLFWKAENPSVARMVSPGVFEGVSRGSTIIYVCTYDLKCIYYCACTVN